MTKLLKSRSFRYIVVLLFSFFSVNFFILPSLFPIPDDYNQINQHEDIQHSSWTPIMQSFCLKAQQRIEYEQTDEQIKYLYENNIQFKSPDFSNSTERQSAEIPYRYFTWRSSPDLSRRLTPCDHYIYTELLTILDHFFRRHRITYLIMDGTLLGSYTFHDFLPWDDDVDLRVSIDDRLFVQTFLQQELGDVITMTNITDEYGNYDRLHFPWTPRAGAKNWTYPFIDLFYFDQNTTHLWRTDPGNRSIPDCAIYKRYVFPVVWRPFGRIWLPAPREPSIVFELLRWRELGKIYYAKSYSHKHERSIPSMSGRAQAQQLHSYYPWVERYCLGMHCTEQLITMFNNTNIIIHSVHFEKYRTELVFDSELENKKCPL